MASLHFPQWAVSFVFFAQAVGSMDTFIAAVYEHAVILPNKTESPVSTEEALLLINKNIDILESAIKLAARQVTLFCSCLRWDIDCSWTRM
jgi:pantetheine hydrolase